MNVNCITYITRCAHKLHQMTEMKTVLVVSIKLLGEPVQQHRQDSMITEVLCVFMILYLLLLVTWIVVTLLCRVYIGCNVGVFL